MKKNIKYIILFILLFIIFYYLNNFFFSINNTQQNLNNSIFNIISKTNIKLDNNLGIKGKTNSYKNLEEINIIGKGFFINKSGEFLTCKHLFNNHLSFFYINIDNKNYDFEIIKKFETKDLVLGKIKDFENENFLNINLNKHDYLIYQGQEIFSYKNNKKNIGKILEKSINIKELNLENLVKTNIKLIPGDSGSPVFNKKGKVIGIFTAIKRGENISYFTTIK